MCCTPFRNINLSTALTSRIAHVTCYKLLILFEMEIKELRELIAVSLYLSPCTEKDLGNRDFLKTISEYGIGRQLQRLDYLGATYYDKNDLIHIKKSWAKKNLKGYDIDFRTDKEKKLDGMTDFARSVYGL